MGLVLSKTLLCLIALVVFGSLLMGDCYHHGKHTVIPDSEEPVNVNNFFADFLESFKNKPK
jgi:hypothetical protein